ncbi:putative xanthine/uracil/vitamin C permease [Helianthus anomalus]
MVICRENSGALALTKVGSQRVIQISAAFMLFFSVFGKKSRLFLYLLSRGSSFMFN